MDMKTFLDRSGHAALAAAVIEQSGGWEQFQQTAKDVANHGADAGFSGWCYYAETAAFAKANRDTIRDLVRECADNLGETMVGLVLGFRCLNVGSEITQDDIGEVLWGNGEGEMAYYIQNALAWFALEQMAWEFANIEDEEAA